MTDGRTSGFTAPSEADIALIARPMRLGVLVPHLDPFSWPRMFASALTSQTRLWGGAGNFVLPLEAATEDNALLCALVDLLDPDGWVLFMPSHHDLEELDQPRFDAWFADAEKFAREFSDSEDELDRFLHEPIAEPELPEEVARLLVRRGAPVHHEGSADWLGFVSGNYAESPLTALKSLAGLLVPVLDVAAPQDDVGRLLAASQVGLLSPHARKELDQSAIGRQAHPAPDKATLMRWVYQSTGPDGTSPWALSEHGLRWALPPGYGRTQVTVVVGDQALDFALSHALRRAGVLALWVPTSYLSATADLALVQRAATSQAVRRGTPLAVTSISDVQAARDFVESMPSGPRRPESIRLIDWQEAIPDRAMHLVAPNSLGLPQHVPVRDGLTPQLPTPMPAVAAKEPSELGWMVEVRTKDWIPIRNQLLAPTLLKGQSTVEARVSRTGIAYGGPSPLHRYGIPLELQLSNPRLRIASLLDQLQHIALASGWSCTLGGKGQFAVGAGQLFGGLEALCVALKDESFAQLMAAFLDGAEDAPGLQLADRRRYLTLNEMASGDPASRGWVERLERHQALSRGLVLKCERCRHADWYSPRDTDPVFRCTRCSLESRPSSEHWLTTGEPCWRYRLDEVLFQFLRHRGDIPALTVFERFQNGPTPYEAVTELELRDPSGNDCEIDLAVVQEGQLWIGEAFKGSRYKQGAKEQARIERLRSIAAVFEARGVLVATAHDELAEITRRRLLAAFPGPWPTLELRSKTWALNLPAQLIDDPG